MERIRQRSNEIDSRKSKLPFVLSIAGIDPSGGAGLLSDIKTFQCCGVYGLGVMSCNTIQTADTLYDIQWQTADRILAAVEKLNERYLIRAVKIGVMQDLNMLQKVLVGLRTILPDLWITWDPVLKASAGSNFFSLSPAELMGENRADWRRILSLTDLITPNAKEAVVLSQLLGLRSRDAEVAASKSSLDPFMRQLACFTHILLKAGHLLEGPAADWLYLKAKEAEGASVVPIRNMAPKEVDDGSFIEKHGSGCVHSSFLTAMLARGKALTEAALMAKAYMEAFLNTGEHLLGVHGPLWDHDRLQNNLY